MSQTRSSNQSANKGRPSKKVKDGTPRKGHNTGSASRDHNSVLTSRSSSSSNHLRQIPLELQQIILDTFRTSFASRFSGQLASILQEIKGHLYNRDFESAFGSEEYLEAYAVRWSPSRTLCYLGIFSACLDDRLRSQKTSTSSALGPQSLLHQLHELSLLPGPGRGAEDDLGASDGGSTRRLAFNVTSLGGGGGAEVVALSAWLSRFCSREERSSQDSHGHGTATGVKLSTSITAVDIADWSNVLTKLEDSMTTSAAASASHSTAEKDDARRVKLPSSQSDIELNFHQHDILELSAEELEPLVKEASLITLMFTLNELYSASMSQTTRLLLQISSFVKKETLLLVVDSPGSYSTVVVGASASAKSAAQKKYPMHWLLDHTLLPAESGKLDEECGWKWEKLVTDESQWFRLPPGLKYPIELEDMRYQMHLYQRA
ncbi:MAG: hypothetical protein M1837_006745 [Sclerophora amabilis]|nr:MAG: hypothetical protein M1837_006745 [Sclerophora amabilis]